MKKVKHSMLCVTGVYVRDVTTTSCLFVLHLNVSCLSICCSCWLWRPAVWKFVADHRTCIIMKRINGSLTKGFVLTEGTQRMQLSLEEQIKFAQYIIVPLLRKFSVLTSKGSYKTPEWLGLYFTRLPSNRVAFSCMCELKLCELNTYICNMQDDALCIFCHWFTIEQRVSVSN